MAFLHNSIIKSESIILLILIKITQTYKVIDNKSKKQYSD